MTPQLSVRGLCVNRGTSGVLRGMDLDVAAGEVCALMGTSGAGKTTALRAICALEPIAAGTITVGDFTLGPGLPPPESRLRPLRRGVGMVFQGQSLFEHLTVLENVMLAPIHAVGSPLDYVRDMAHKLLTSLGVAGRSDAFPRQLSGGEAQRVAIARALALDPVMLLMDEPTSALDPARRGALGHALRALARQGRGLLIATHDVEFASAHADRVMILADGVVVEQGTAAAVLTRPAHEATRELLRSDIHDKEHM